VSEYRPVEISVVGSFVTRSIPDDLPALYRDGVLVDPRNGTPMEMDAYSVYLALKALERTRGYNLYAEKLAIAKTMLGRMRTCASVWSHGAWSGSPEEIHMRFTAASVRLLVEALHDGLVDGPDIVAWALKRHLGYSEPLTTGLWYLHDSFEVRDARLPHPQKPKANAAWGSGPADCLVLNTHVDTLSTILDVLRRVDLRDEDREFFAGQLRQGLAALDMVLRPNDSRRWRTFASFDSAMRSLLFGTFGGSRRPFRDIRHRAAKAVRRAIVDGYFPLRRDIRGAMPGFVYGDGYLERDISLKGRGFEYHVVNAFDLIRLVLQAGGSAYPLAPALRDRCERLVDAAIDYAIGSTYWNYQIASMRESARAILLCETILARIGSMETPGAPRPWMSAYCAIRRALPPSAAILGYDPFIVDDETLSYAPPENCDIVHLRNGTTLLVDLRSEDAVLAASNRSHAAGSVRAAS
jgi:hypothetical protein